MGRLGIGGTYGKYSKEIREYILSVKAEWQWYSDRYEDIKG